MTETSTASGHIRIDNRIITLYAPRFGPNVVIVYVVLKLHADHLTGRCYPSLATICRLSKLSRPTVLNAIRTLEELRLITVERTRTKGGKPKVNFYTLLPVPVGQAPLPSLLNALEQQGKAALPSLVNELDHQGKAALPEQDLINKTQLNKREGVQRQDARLDHPAVAAYREVCKLTPNETQRAAIATTVTDVPKWRQVMQRWLLKDYRKSNVEGMLDWYEQGIPEGRGGNGRNSVGGRLGFQSSSSGDRRGSGGPDTPEDIARRDAEWQKLARESVAER